MAKKKWGCLIAGGVVLGTAVSLCFTPAYGDTVGDILSASARYPSAFEEAKKAGAVITPSDLRNRYGAHGGPNAAADYRMAIAAYVSRIVPKSDHLYEFSRDIMKSGSNKDLALKLNRYRFLDSYLDRATTFSVCDFEYQWEDGINLTYPELSHLKRFARVLGIESVIAAAKGDRVTCFRKLRQALVVADHFGQFPLAYGCLLQSGVRKMTLSFLARSLSIRQDDPGFLSEARRFVQSFPIDADFRRALSGDALISLLVYDEIKKSGLSAMCIPYYNLDRVPVVMTAWKSRSLEMWTEVFRESPPPRSDWRAWRELGIRLQNEWDSKNSASYYIPTMVSGPWIAGTAYSVAGVETSRNLMATLIDVADWKFAHRALPDRPPVPRADPFSNAPLKYRVEGDKFLVWSVGPNFRNKGDLNDRSSSRDFTFGFELRP